MGFQNLGSIWRQVWRPTVSSEHHLLGEEIGVGKCCDAGDLLSLYASDFPVPPASLIQTHQNSQALFTKVASVALGIANSLKPTGTEPFPCSVKIPGTSTVSTSIAAVLCLAAFLYGYGLSTQIWRAWEFPIVHNPTAGSRNFFTTCCKRGDSQPGGILSVAQIHIRLLLDATQGPCGARHEWCEKLTGFALVYIFIAKHVQSCAAHRAAAASPHHHRDLSS